jgi:hypothetical protein
MSQKVSVRAGNRRTVFAGPPLADRQGYVGVMTR